MFCQQLTLYLLSLLLSFSYPGPVFASSFTISTRQNKIPQANLDAADDKSDAIKEELKRAKLSKWAGDYYASRGLGFNYHLLLAPASGFVYTWHGCLGLYELIYGRSSFRNG